jgi:hypothetical protein
MMFSFDALRPEIGRGASRAAGLLGQTLYFSMEQRL